MFITCVHAVNNAIGKFFRKYERVVTNYSQKFTTPRHKNFTLLCFCYFHVTLFSYVIHLQTKEKKESQNAWFFGAQENPRRERCSLTPPPQRSHSSSALAQTMLPKSRRVPRVLFSKTARISRIGTFLTLRIVPIHGRSRFAFVTSKKAASKAVARNRLRRFGYRAVADNLHLFPDARAYLFSFKPASAHLSRGDITKDILNLLKLS